MEREGERGRRFESGFKVKYGRKVIAFYDARLNMFNLDLDGRKMAWRIMRPDKDITGDTVRMEKLIGVSRAVDRGYEISPVAEKFIDQLIAALLTIKDKDSLIIGIDSGWIPGDLMSSKELNLLIQAVLELSQEKRSGLPRLTVIRGEGESLAAELDKASGGNYSKILVLGPRSVLDNDSPFTRLRGKLYPKIGALLAGVDPGKLNKISEGKTADALFLEMLTLAIELAVEPATGDKIEKFGVEATRLDLSGRLWEFVPSAALVEPDDLRVKYDKEIEVLVKA
jgi:hypothetical protein